MTAFFVGLYNFLFCSVLLTFTGEINQRNQENEVPLWRVLSKESSGFKNFYERKARVSRLLKVNIWGILFANNEQFLFVFHIYVRSRNTRWTGNRGEQSESDGIYFLALFIRSARAPWLLTYQCMILKYPRCCISLHHQLVADYWLLRKDYFFGIEARKKNC